MAHVTRPKHLANPQEQRESERRARQAELNRRFAAAQEAAKAGNFATILVVTAILVILAVIIVIVRIVAMIVMINSKNDSHTHSTLSHAVARCCEGLLLSGDEKLRLYAYQKQASMQILPLVSWESRNAAEHGSCHSGLCRNQYDDPFLLS